MRGSLHTFTAHAAIGGCIALVVLRGDGCTSRTPLASEQHVAPQPAHLGLLWGSSRRGWHASSFWLQIGCKKACGSDAGTGVAGAHEHHLRLPAEAHASLEQDSADVQHGKIECCWSAHMNVSVRSEYAGARICKGLLRGVLPNCSRKTGKIRTQSIGWDTCIKAANECHCRTVVSCQDGPS